MASTRWLDAHYETVCVQSLVGHKEDVLALAVTPNGKTVISGSADATIRLWDTDTWECKEILTGHSKKVYSVHATGDGKKIISGSADFSVKVWDIEQGQMESSFEEDGHKDVVWSVCSFKSKITGHENALLAVSASADNSIKIWETETGECLQTFGSGNKDSHSMDVTTVIAGDDGKCIYSASYDTQIKKWDVERKECLWTIDKAHKRYVLDLALGKNETVLVSSSFDHEVAVWDLSGTGPPKLTAKAEGPHKHKRRVNCVDISSDGETIISGAYDCTVRVWTAKAVHKHTLEGHTDKVLSVVLAGDFVYSASWDHTIKCWQTRPMTQEKIKLLEDQERKNTETVSNTSKQVLVKTNNDTHEKPLNEIDQVRKELKESQQKLKGTQKTLKGTQKTLKETQQTLKETQQELEETKKKLKELEETQRVKELETAKKDKKNI